MPLRKPAALAAGYPECLPHHAQQPPAWRASVSGFGLKVRDWLLQPRATFMHLAIFMDAHAVAGDRAAAGRRASA